MSASVGRRPAWTAAAGRWPAWAVAAAVVVWLLATAGLRPLALPDEGRYVGVAWEMLRSGDWLVPTLDGLPFFHKPPLFYWLTAGSIGVFGPTLWAGRIASVIGAAAAALALYAFASRRDQAAFGQTVLVVLLTQPFFFVGAQFANLDMLVAGCISITILAAAAAALELEQGHRARVLLATAYGAAGLGLLAKGLIGGLLPALTIVGWLLWTRRPALLWRLVWWPGLLLFAAVGLPWFVAVQQRHPGFFDYFVIGQHFRRFAQSGFNNQQPFWFYVPVLMALVLPWSAWGLFTARANVRARPADPQRLRALMVIWTLVIVGFFSLPRSKLIGYVLPALPPLAWLIADGLRARYGPQPLTAAAVRRTALLTALACVAFVIAAAVVQQRRSLQPLAQTLAAARQPGEPLVMLDRYQYELAFYGRQSGSVTVVDDWAAARRENRDNWRKELTDAADFVPLQGEATLLPREHLTGALCAASADVWLLGDRDAAARYPVLARAEPVARAADVQLWRLRRSAALATALACPQTPSADSPGK